METSENVAKLIVQHEGGTPYVLELQDSLTIGRSPKNQLRIGDPNVSRYHAEFQKLAKGRYRLTDIGSANGTWLNEKRLSSPKELADGDQIVIGSLQLRFVAPPKVNLDLSEYSGEGTTPMRRQQEVLILISDIRDFTSMSEVLPREEFSVFVSSWFQESSRIIGQHGGTLDKFMGDALMAYWFTESAHTSSKVNAVLSAAQELIDLAQTFSKRLSSQFPGYTFRIGVGINMGEALVGNVGTPENPSFTVMGDCVNVAFRIESLTKEKGYSVVTSRSVTECAAKEFEFVDLGLVEVKGRKEPVSIRALKSGIR